MNMSNTTCVALRCLLVALIVVAAVHETAAVTCSPSELAPCAGAITGSQSPSTACCSKLREQRPCLCGYLKDPALRPYVDSPNAKRVAAACKVPTPAC